MNIIAPSILAADFSKLGEECLDVLEKGAQWIHFDVMDGHFVPNISVGIPVLASLSKAVPDAFYDVHLMIDDPVTYSPDFAAAGADLITFHLEAPCDTMAAIEKIRALGCRVGLALKPGTPAEEIYPYLPLVDMALVMTVEPGFGGQKFMADMCPKVAAIKARALELDLAELIIQVDGGIAPSTAPQVAAAGANCFVAGSSVFGAADRRAAISDMQKA